MFTVANRVKSSIVQFVLVFVSGALFVMPGKSLGGDCVLFTLPGTNQTILLQGRVKTVARDLLEYSHPQFGSITLNRFDTLHFTSDGYDEVKKFRNAATQSKRAEDFVEAAKQALRYGQLNDCFDCLSQAFQLDPDNASLRIPIQMRRSIRALHSDDKEDEARIREVVGLDRYQVATSQHYVMLYDPTASSLDRGVPPIVRRRLQVLEQTFEAFFMCFALQGILLEAPSNRMMVISFSDEQAYQKYAVNFDPRLLNAGGFWSSRNNVIAFYDQGTTPAMKRMLVTLDELKKQKSMARGTAASQRTGQLANAYEMLTRILQEQSDVEVMTHEATHQLAANSGLLPRDRITLRWAHEGFASYCETPSGGLGSGMGGVNANRLTDHRAVLRDPNRQGLRNIVSDNLVLNAKTQLEAVEAYGPAWALIHFLMSSKQPQLMQYLQKAKSLSADASGDAKIEIFRDSFGELDRIQLEFDEYTSNLKTDLERLRGYQAK